MDEKKRNEIVRLLKESEPNDKGKTAEPKIEISGNNNIVGNGNIQANGDIHFISPQLVNNTVVKTADGTIDAAQKAELQRLIEEWVESSNAVKKRTLTYGAAWKSLNATFDANSYHEIKMEQFEEARRWIMQKMGIISGMKSAPKKMPGWRTKTIQYIKAACKNDLNDANAYKSYIEQKFQCDSLAKLGDNDRKQSGGPSSSRRPDPFQVWLLIFERSIHRLHQHVER